MTPQQAFSFGPFRIDLANATLWRGPDQLPLKPKSFSVLRSLLERPHQLVTKEELLDAHWGNVAVGEAVLKTCISEIRHALGESASQPEFIETLPRKGYRILAKLLPMAQSTGLSDTHAFVGREQELLTMSERWEAVKQGDRHLIFVTGEPGIGKTSLVNTFLNQVTAAGKDWIGRGQCIEQYGAGEAYLPILEALNRLCQQVRGERLVTYLRQYAPT